MLGNATKPTQVNKEKVEEKKKAEERCKKAKVEGEVEFKIYF